MDEQLEALILQVMGAHSVVRSEVLQELWSGYGQIIRVFLSGAQTSAVVIKRVQLPEQSAHPRGWNTDVSHERKVHSYEVETAFYQYYAQRCGNICRVPHCFGVKRLGENIIIFLEDLNVSGYAERRYAVNTADVQACLRWLAGFHACFMGEAPDHLWETGTYWHLATRPDELDALDDSALKQVASEVDRRLSGARYLTFVHGDAKLANFCFSGKYDEVAAVDFQYVGGGCGMKDVAYFLGSCLTESECEKQEQHWLNYYFEHLGIALGHGHDADAIEAEWRGLYPYAWTDFHRFMKGWCPGHWKITGYSERLARQVITEVNDGV